MAKRNTPDSAVRQYLYPLERALGCVSSERLSAISRLRFEVGQEYSLVLNDGHPVSLKGEVPLLLTVGQIIRIDEVEPSNPMPFHVRIVKYRYVVSSASYREIVAYHWTPEADPAAMITTPHLHVGSVNISDTAPLDPKTFNKLHIPTGYVSLHSVLRFLITDVGVQPRRADWSELLAEPHP